MHSPAPPAGRSSLFALPGFCFQASFWSFPDLTPLLWDIAADLYKTFSPAVCVKGYSEWCCFVSLASMLPELLLNCTWGCEPLSCAPLTPASDVSLAPQWVNSEPRLWETPHLPVQICMLSSESVTTGVSRCKQSQNLEKRTCIWNPLGEGEVSGLILTHPRRARQRSSSSSTQEGWTQIASLAVSCSPGQHGNWAAVSVVLAFPLENDSTALSTLRKEIVGGFK